MQHYKKCLLIMVKFYLGSIFMAEEFSQQGQQPKDDFTIRLAEENTRRKALEAEEGGNKFEYKLPTTTREEINRNVTERKNNIAELIANRDGKSHTDRVGERGESSGIVI